MGAQHCTVSNTFTEQESLYYKICLCQTIFVTFTVLQLQKWFLLSWQRFHICAGQVPTLPAEM